MIVQVLFNAFSVVTKTFSSLITLLPVKAGNCVGTAVSVLSVSIDGVAVGTIDGMAVDAAGVALAFSSMAVASPGFAAALCGIDPYSWSSLCSVSAQTRFFFVISSVEASALTDASPTTIDRHSMAQIHFFIFNHSFPHSYIIDGEAQRYTAP